MIECLNKIRKPEYVSSYKKIVYPLIVLALGIILGVVSKALDETASNMLPTFIEQLDLRNFLSRIGVWMFIGICIAFYSKTPLRGAINTLLFFVGMVGSYYIYTIMIAGFFPKEYMIFWFIMTALSSLLAVICWYAKGTHIISILLSSVIFMMMMRQAFSFGFWYFDIRYFLELLLWIASVCVLYQTPKQILKVSIVGVILFFTTSQINILYGML